MEILLGFWLCLVGATLFVRKLKRYPGQSEGFYPGVFASDREEDREMRADEARPFLFLLFLGLLAAFIAA